MNPRVRGGTAGRPPSDCWRRAVNPRVTRRNLFKNPLITHAISPYAIVNRLDEGDNHHAACSSATGSSRINPRPYARCLPTPAASVSANAAGSSTVNTPSSTASGTIREAKPEAGALSPRCGRVIFSSRKRPMRTMLIVAPRRRSVR